MFIFLSLINSWLIIKSDCFFKAIHIFNNTNVQITAQGRRHLGAALGTGQLRNEYIFEKINKCVEELHVLSEIAKLEYKHILFKWSEAQIQLLYEKKPWHRQTIHKS